MSRPDLSAKDQGLAGHDQDVIARLVAGLDHQSSSLGPFEIWPPALKVAFRLMAASRFPMFITWGDEFPYLYNAACIPIVGPRHPAAFGRPFREVWPEVWPDLSPLLRAALAGTTSYRERLSLSLVRDAGRVETWFTFSYSPLFDEAGVVRGVLSVAVEETATVVAERRMVLRQALDDVLRAETDPDAMLSAATGVLAGYLGTDSAEVLEIDAADPRPLPPLAALSAEELRLLADNVPILRTAAPASLMVPKTEAGRLAAIIRATIAGARDWSAEDVSVLRESGLRIRAATQRARAEAAVRKGEEELRLLTDALPVLISYVDADERYRFGNRAYESWFGQAPEDIIGKPVAEVVGDRAYDRLKPTLQRALAGEAAVIEDQIPYRDGGERYVQITYVPRLDGTGVVQGYYALVQDIGDQKRAEAALRQSERRLSEVLESVSDGFFALDADWRFSVFNRACEQAFAMDRDAVLGNVIWDVFPATRQSVFEARLRAIPENQLADSFEVDSVITPGTLFEIRAAPKDGGGVAVAFSNITERKRAEEHRQLLVNELNHRVKNTLAVVQAIASQSFRADEPIDAARRAFEARLATLAAAHTLLTAQNWEAALLADIVEGAVAVGAERSRFTLTGPPIALSPQTAVSLALALHELCTNAVKYGALSVPGGAVTITWQIAADAEGAPRLRFVWAEAGGPPVTVPISRGFGSRLLESGLARELGGTVVLDFAAEGVKCRIDAPLPVAG